MYQMIAYYLLSSKHLLSRKMWNSLSRATEDKSVILLGFEVILFYFSYK